MCGLVMFCQHLSERIKVTRMKVMKKQWIVIISIVVLVSSVFLINSNWKSSTDSLKNQENNTASSYQYFTAVTYFGNAWPINFWNSDFSSTDQNMYRIQKDGFNTIVLVVPWGEFQPGISPIKYNDIAFDRLNYIIDKARSHHLDVVLRISYPWDLYPNDQLPALQRFEDLNYDNKTYDAWLGYIHKIYTDVKDYKNVKFSFISWEDFWEPVNTASYFQEYGDRVKFAQQVGFTDYLKSKYSLDSISDIYGYKINSWDILPTPLRKSPAFALFYQFYDDIMIQKFLKPAQGQYPGLSMEIRVDDDPIYHPSGAITWYSHSSTYNFTGSNYTTIYYNIAMGARNNHDYETASTALSLMKHIFSNVENHVNGKKIFIDQFVWYDNTQDFDNNTKIHDNETGSFLQGSCEYLKKHTNGYGIWVYQDHAWNIVYNPTFSLGTSGWLTNGTIHIERGGVNLGQNATITQKFSSVSKSGIVSFYDESKTAIVSFHGWSKTPTSDISIESGNTKVIEHINQSPSTYSFHIPFVGLENFDITFKTLNGSATITNIKLYNFIQQGDIYNIESQPRKSLEPVQKLNKCLTNATR